MVCKPFCPVPPSLATVSRNCPSILHSKLGGACYPWHCRANLLRKNFNKAFYDLNLIIFLQDPYFTYNILIIRQLTKMAIISSECMFVLFWAFAPHELGRVGWWWLVTALMWFARNHVQGQAPMAPSHFKWSPLSFPIQSLLLSIVPPSFKVSCQAD